MILNINSNALVAHTNRLEKLHRSALPVAIRGTLNNAAFDVKQNTMPKSAKKEFVQRQPNFFKANSRVEMAKGFNVSTMKATVGFVEGRLKGDKNFAVRDLEEQEYGGEIKGRSLIPIDESRRGSSSVKPVRANYRLSNIKNVINANKVQSRNKKQKFIRAAFAAKKIYGNNAFVLGNIRNKGRLTLSKIRTVRSTGARVVISRVPVYSYQAGFVARVKRTGFMKRASLESGLKIEQYFIRQAQRQIDRLQ